MQDKKFSAMALPIEDLALVTIKVVCWVTGMQKSFVYGAMRAGQMPAPLRLGSRCSRFRAGDIREYLRDPLNWTPAKAIDAPTLRVAV